MTDDCLSGHLMNYVSAYTWDKSQDLCAIGRLYYPLDHFDLMLFLKNSKARIMIGRLEDWEGIQIGQYPVNQQVSLCKYQLWQFRFRT